MMKMFAIKRLDDQTIILVCVCVCVCVLCVCVCISLSLHVVGTRHLLAFLVPAAVISPGGNTVP